MSSKIGQRAILDAKENEMFKDLLGGATLVLLPMSYGTLRIMHHPLLTPLAQKEDYYAPESWTTCNS